MQPLLLNCDWLGLSVLYDTQSDWHRPPFGHTFVDLDGTNVWRKRRILFNEYAEKVATILYEPKSAIIDSRAGLIEIANEWLYHGVGVLKILDMLNDSKYFSIRGLSRLDLAVDFNPTDEQWNIIQRLANGSAYVGGKRSGSGFWSVVKNSRLADRYQGLRIPHCQSWGHKTTAVKWKLYYKSKELLDGLGGSMWSKPYIVDCWRDAGIEKSDAWRLEVSIKDCKQLEYNGQPLDWEVWRNCQPQELFKALYKGRFNVRSNDGHADKSNDKELKFLPIHRSYDIRVAKPKGTTQRNGRITLLRHLITSLDEHEVLLDDASRESVLWHIQDIVEHNGLDSYFSMMVGVSIDDFIEETRCKAYDLKDVGFSSLVDKDHRQIEFDTMQYMGSQLWSEYENSFPPQLCEIPIAPVEQLDNPLVAQKPIYKQGSLF